MNLLINIFNSSVYLCLHQEDKPKEEEEEEDDDDDDEDEDEVIEDEFVRSSQHRYGKEGTRSASIMWFKETQSTRLKDGGTFYSWFHGIITRRLVAESERLHLFQISSDRDQM